jgi:hypothetical protein
MFLLRSAMVAVTIGITATIVITPASANSTLDETAPVAVVQKYDEMYNVTEYEALWAEDARQSAQEKLDFLLKKKAVKVYLSKSLTKLKRKL